MTSRIAVFVVTTGLLFVTGAATPQERGQGAAPAPGGQTPAPGRGRQSGPGYLKLFDSTMPFDPHDLAGIWSPNGNGFGGGGRCRDCGDRGYSFEFPVFTPAGQAVFDKNVPSYGRAKDSDDAKAHPEEHIGRRRAQPPALGNDTYGTCNPMGMPRAILYPDPVEFIVLPDRIYQHFQWGYGLRTIWTDGRKLPKPEDIDLPRWWGYATSRWEGNTLVVDSTGYDERTWVDYFGYPHSDQMVLQERYTRLNFDTLELKMTITDPRVLFEAVDQRDEAHASAPEGLHQVVRVAIAARRSVRPGERNRIQSCHPRSRRHRKAAGTGAPVISDQRRNDDALAGE